MATTIYGCDNPATGQVDFDVCKTADFSACFVVTGDHAGQVKLIVSGTGCDDTYYGCYNNTTGKYEVIVPDDCCCPSSGTYTVTLHNLTICDVWDDVNGQDVICSWVANSNFVGDHIFPSFTYRYLMCCYGGNRFEVYVYALWGGSNIPCFKNTSVNPAGETNIANQMPLDGFGSGDYCIGDSVPFRVWSGGSCAPVGSTLYSGCDGTADVVRN